MCQYLRKIIVYYTVDHAITNAKVRDQTIALKNVRVPEPLPPRSDAYGPAKAAVQPHSIYHVTVVTTTDILCQ